MVVDGPDQYRQWLWSVLRLGCAWDAPGLLLLASGAPELRVEPAPASGSRRSRPSQLGRCGGRTRFDTFHNFAQKPTRRKEQPGEHTQAKAKAKKPTTSKSTNANVHNVMPMLMLTPMPGSAQLTLLIYWREPVKLIKVDWSLLAGANRLVSSVQLINTWGSIRQFANSSTGPRSTSSARWPSGLRPSSRLAVNQHLSGSYSHP